MEGGRLRRRLLPQPPQHSIPSAVSKWRCPVVQDQGGQRRGYSSPRSLNVPIRTPSGRLLISPVLWPMSPFTPTLDADPPSRWVLMPSQTRYPAPLEDSIFLTRSLI